MSGAIGRGCPGTCRFRRPDPAEDEMGMLNGKVAFITGAASGIGRAAAIRFAREGAKVAVSDTDEADGAKVCREIEKAGGKAIFTQCDVSDSGQVERAIDRTVKEFGHLDVVFANAGINGVWAP